MRCLIGLEHGGNIVLGMTGGEQHAGDGEDVLDALLAQAIEAEVDHRVGEFEIAVFDRNIGQSRLEGFGESGEFADGALVAAAMAAQHDAGARRQEWQIDHFPSAAPALVPDLGRPHRTCVSAPCVEPPRNGC